MARTLAIALLTLAFALAAAPEARAGIGMGIIEEHPSAAKERWREKAEEAYQEGMKARAAGDTTNAVRFLLRCANMGKMRIDSKYPEMAFNELKVIVEEARKELVVARDFLSGEDAAAGMLELKRITRTYFGLWPAKEAGKLMRQLEGDPKFQAALREAELAEELARAQTLEAEAAALVKPPDPKPPEAAPSDGPASALPTAPPETRPEGVTVAAVAPKTMTPEERREERIAKLLEAYEIYGRLARDGAGTKPGIKAEAARRRLEQDADLIGRIRDAQAEKQAREWLGLATNYFRAGRLDSAREYCTKILSECPKTPQAAEAKALLDGMK